MRSLESLKGKWSILMEKLNSVELSVGGMDASESIKWVLNCKVSCHMICD